MKVQCIGVMRLHGKSKAGSDFDMCQIKVLRPSESFDTEKLHCRAHGFESVDLQLSPDCLPQFSELRFPLTLDLQIDERLTRRGIESFVVGFNPPAAVKVA